MRDTRYTSRVRLFDPARDGLRNPVGDAAQKIGGGSLPRRFDSLLYGRGLCFGMVAAALLRYDERAADNLAAPLTELPLDPELLAVLRAYHRRQYRPRAVLAAVRAWAGSLGGRPERVLGRLRLPGSSPDPHLLCFGPALNRRFFWCFARAHAVAPYRVEERGAGARVYVYDPNHPGDRGRFVVFWRDGAGRYAEFAYNGFRSREGWGLTLIPMSVLSRRKDRGEEVARSRSVR